MRLVQPPTARVALNGPANSRSDTFPNGTFYARSGPAWGPVNQARIRQDAYTR